MRSIYDVLEELRFIANRMGEDGIPYAESSLNAQIVDILEGYIKKLELHLFDNDYVKAFEIVKKYLFVPEDMIDIYNHDIEIVDEFIKQILDNYYNEEDEDYED